MLHMELARIIINEASDEQVIVLREAQGKRAFPIMIGIWEAVAIDRNLKGKKTPRPMTHDLIENVIRGLSGELERVVIHDLRDRTFYASLHIKSNGKKIEIDSRPSDAVAIAVLMKAPLYVEERVITTLAGQAKAAAEEQAEEDGESRPVDPEEEPE